MAAAAPYCLPAVSRFARKGPLSLFVKLVSIVLWLSISITEFALDCVVVVVVKSLCERVSMYAQKNTCHCFRFRYRDGDCAFIHLGLRPIALTSFVFYFLSLV